MPNNPVKSVIIDPQIVSYRVDIPALEDLADGDGIHLDAAITSQPTGLQAIKDGLAIKQLGEPVYFEYLSATMDKRSNLDSLGLAARITELIRQMHADETLVKLSLEYFETDYTTIAGEFDIKPFGQIP